MKTGMILRALSLSLLFALSGLVVVGAGQAAKIEKATFAGGCFWSMTIPFEALKGVVSVTAGYTGGHARNPTYEEVGSGTTGHAESVEVVYDPSKVTYAKLLDVFWHNIDPTVKDRQFCDTGEQYRSAIFYHNEEQKRLAEDSKKAIMQSRVLPGPIYTQIVPASRFYRAEEYHQDFHKKNPARYGAYRLGCGRDKRLSEIWGSEAGTH